ncbi:putative F-box protein At4g05475 [Bidens hawaiensis]|uniref:putative F-box protein At4g05475 n=1 Tax=Bidens hawaiensis TaxID=980011 RepID=UPI00404AE27C
MCKNVVDRSQGQLVDLTIIGFGNDELRRYVADRSSQLRRLHHNGILGGIQNETIQKLSSLKELRPTKTIVSKDNIEAFGRYCPLLKKLKLNEEGLMIGTRIKQNEIAIAIGENLPELTHLEL